MQPHEDSSNLMQMNSAFSHLVIQMLFWLPSKYQAGTWGYKKNDMHSLSLMTTNQPTEIPEAFHSVKGTVSGWFLKVNAYEWH